MKEALSVISLCPEVYPIFITKMINLNRVQSKVIAEVSGVPSKRKVHHALSSDARAETLEFLYKKPRDVEEIAKKLKLQSTTVRHHIEALLEAGLLESYEERTKDYLKNCLQKEADLFLSLLKGKDIISFLS